MNFLFGITFALMFIIPSLQIEDDCQPPSISCFGLCVDSQELCPVEISCQEGFVKINHYTCSTRTDFAVPSQCKQNEECWNGSCEKDRKTNCPTMMTCPPSIRIRCPDNSCVSAIEECPNTPDCPTFLPLRCPNGECRNSLEDCPSLIICPSIFAIQCNDGSCRMLPDECLAPTLQTQCVDRRMTRCPDGTCKSAKFLCSSSVTCPNGLMKCWNGKCTDGECDKPTESQSRHCDKEMVNCPFDYSCKKDISLCPTSIICPIDRAVKCWDMSCKETITKCPKYQECPGGMIACPDGSCGQSKCGTQITCSDDTPFKCFDNTCRVNPQDCPKQQDCPSEAPIFCWDGRCVLERGECLSAEECRNDQIKCPDNLCKNSIEECKAIIGCPNGFSRCSNGVCRKKLSDCQEHQCPLTFPYRCDNGMCVSNIDFCDKENGCPYNKPIKCKDGGCVDDQSLCPDENAIKCENKLCPDGSCIPNESICSEQNGCPIDLPRLCGDGSCIPLKGICPIPICPIEKPVRCSNGACALTISNCPKNERTSSSTLIFCSDGTEKPYFEECKPLIPCPSYQVRCENGSCQNLIDYCPQAKTCPNNQIRCKNGSCSPSLEECLNDSGCPNNKNYKCSQTGLCVKKAQDCLNYQNQFNHSNGCPQSLSIKCVSGKCVSELADCNINECPREAPVLCLNGSCVVKQRDCSKQAPDCIEGYEECPDGQCRAKGGCLVNNNCSIKEPFRCMAGECKRYPLKHDDNDSDGCSVGIKCPDHKPILCADGSCKEKSIFCLTHLECPDALPYNCFERTCALDSSKCPQDIFQCPAKNPILCPNGNCISELIDCFEVACPSWKPYLCITGLCETKPSNCITKDIIKCHENEVLCQDGTCRQTFARCPLFAGCIEFSSPIKCSDASCVKPSQVCPSQTNIQCQNDEKLCEDGICRIQCPDYNGCPNSEPFMCSTGKCLVDIIECIGESNCPQIDYPFRCTDGSCVAFITDCRPNVKGFGSSNLILSIFPGYDLSSDIILDKSNSILGSLFLQSDSITKQDEISSGTVNVMSIPQSIIQDTYIKYNNTRMEDVLQVFPFSKLKNNYELEYEYAILSSVVSIKFIDPNIQIRNYFLLTLAYDFPFLHESQLNVIDANSTNNTSYSLPSFKALNHLTDVCLGKLNEETREWQCVNLEQKTEHLINHQFQGTINSGGIFAVVLHPSPNDALLVMKPNFFADNIVAILVCLFALIIILGIGSYVFVRILRFRKKYKEARKKFAKTEKELDLMKNITFQNVGQIIGDTKEGVIFTENPAFKAIIVEEKSNKRAQQLQSMVNSYLNRQKILDKNNLKLQSTYENINAEYEKLAKYKNSLIIEQDK